MWFTVIWTCLSCAHEIFNKIAGLNLKAGDGNLYKRHHDKYGCLPKACASTKIPSCTCLTLYEVKNLMFQSN